MMYIVINSWLVLIAVIAGYFMGSSQNRTDKTIDIPIPQRLKKHLGVGVVKRPSQMDILKRTDPYVKREEEVKAALKKTLDNIPELKQNG